MEITMQRLIFVAVLCLLATGCASQPSFQEQLAARPIPQTHEQIISECASIRTEIVNQQAIGNASQTMTKRIRGFGTPASNILESFVF